MVQLASELSDIRVRGHLAIERDNSKQKPLKIPLMASIVKGSPWASEPLPVGVRRVIASSIPYCRSRASRAALEAFYGIHAFHGHDAAERNSAGIQKLRIPDNASSEHKKVVIREVRVKLARAVLVASAANFKPPDENVDELDIVETELPSLTQTVLGELRLLVGGKGATPSKIAAEAPTLLGLDCVRDHYLQAIGGEDQPECAMEVLRCATRVEPMRGIHRGKLVADLLNLRQTIKPYDVRKEAYRDLAKLSGEELNERESHALIRFAKVLVSLERSPCRAEADSERANRNHAQLLFGLLEKLTKEDRRDVCVHLVSLIGESLPGLRSVDIDLHHGIGEISNDGLSLLFQQVRQEFTEWTEQYRTRVDPHQWFLNIGWVELATRSLLWHHGKDFRQSTREGAIGGYLHVRRRFATPDELESLVDGTFEVDKHFDDSSRSSLILFAQMLAYNEANDYWAKAIRIHGLSESDKPQFPIIPVAEFDHQQARVDGGT